MFPIAPEAEAIAEHVLVVRYRLRSAPMQVAQQLLAAMAPNGDGNLDALRTHLDS